MPGILENNPQNPDWLTNGAWVGSTTPSGIPYAIQFNGFSIAYARDANQITARVRVRWVYQATFRKEMLGYTEWRRGASYLDRYLAVPCPYDPNLRCDSLQLLQYGCDSSRKTLTNNTPGFNNWIDFDWAIFVATFRRFPFSIIDDDATIPFAATARFECSRYTSVRRQFTVRERRIPGLQFQTVQSPAQFIADPAFIPDTTQTFWLVWHQVPIQAFPDVRVSQCLNTVNSQSFPIPLGNVGNPDIDPPLPPIPSTAKVFNAPPESLLFRGLAQPIEAYAGGDGALYYDPAYCFEYRPTVPLAQAGSLGTNGRYAAGINPWGWNGYRLNDGTYVRLKFKGSGQSDTDPGTSPYPTTNHINLFVPGNPY